MSSVQRRFVAKYSQPAGFILCGGAARALPLNDGPCITILLCTCNGARFLAAQLASLKHQSHTNWRLIVSDDHSRDSTLAIVDHFARHVPQSVEVRMGPRRGPTANFLSLAADSSVTGDYFAFCDQDDVWHSDKLRSAIEWMRTVPADVAAAYGARTRLISARGDMMGHSRHFTRPPSFANALVQSIAGANTILFNRATKRLFEQSGPLNVVSHDWWTYQIVSGNGGVFHYDPEPHLDYRQHDANRVGCNKGLSAQLKRLGMLLNGRFATWNDINLAALQRSRHLLSKDARALVGTYEVMRGGSLPARLKAFATSGMRRQTLRGNIALLIAVCLRKI